MKAKTSLSQRLKTNQPICALQHWRFVNVMLDKKPALLLELCDVVEEWLAAPENGQQRVSRSELARQLASDSQICEIPYTRMSTLMEWLGDAQKGRINLEAHRSAANEKIAQATQPARRDNEGRKGKSRPHTNVRRR